MSLQTDVIFVKALQSNAELLGMLPAGDVYNTSIPIPDEELINAPVPYVIVTYDGMQNDDSTKDGYEGDTDRVQIGIEVTAQTRPQLCELVEMIRQTIKNYFETADELDEDIDLVPLDYQLTAQGVMYDPDKPAYGQVLLYACDTKV